MTVGDPILRTNCRTVDQFLEVDEILNSLVGTLRTLQGAGLAANQLGHDIRACVIEVRASETFPDRVSTPLIEMINPRLVSAAETLNEDWEGCFSIPGIMAKVSRPDTIEIEFQDLEMNIVRQKFEGYTARVIQHELDHLNGKLFVDKVQSPASYTTVQNYKKFHLPNQPTKKPA